MPPSKAPGADFLEIERFSLSTL
ncbi:hypothetical protein SGPA1_31117 [Streptomyces misionensis JCM 4497]